MAYIFPRNLQPGWVELGEPPSRPDISQRFESGADSNLRLSNIPIDGKITCEWILDSKQLQDFRKFWAQVELAESFTLPTNFFLPTCDPILAEEAKTYSSTGLWRFTEKYKPEYLRVGTYRVAVTLRGAIL
jgi:hypothetical protein